MSAAHNHLSDSLSAFVPVLGPFLGPSRVRALFVRGLVVVRPSNRSSRIVSSGRSLTQLAPRVLLTRQNMNL